MMLRRASFLFLLLFVFTSTFSIARRISPLASPNVLPFSLVIIRDNSSILSSSSVLSLNKY